MNISDSNKNQSKAIEVKNISKRFKLYENPVLDPIKEFVFFWKRKNYYKEFLALKNISFSVNKGEIVGIIGQNGAGKTTLLKLIAGLLPIDKGHISITGKVTALLALGVGVDPEFSGTETIYYQGLLLGMSKEEIQSKKEAIIEFSELGDFIHRPIRTYSSGMRARLLFSISMSINPEVLIIDEALATGDAFFVNKCSQKIRDLCNSGATILFVSHNLRQVQELCQRCIIFSKGKVIFDGLPHESIEKYISLIKEKKSQAIESQNKKLKSRTSSLINSTRLNTIDFIQHNKKTSTLHIGQPCSLEINLTCSEEIKQARICVEIFSEKSQVPYTYLCNHEDLYISNQKSKEIFSLSKGDNQIKIDIENFYFGDGEYRIDFEIYPGDENYTFSYDTCYCHYTNVLKFQCLHQSNTLFNRGTMVEVPIKNITTSQSTQ